MTVEGAVGATPDPTISRRRWLALGVIGVAQLMVVLDLTVMNIALPSAQQALNFTTADRQWVVTAYSLAFGSLLLAGGKLGDLIGRRTTFLVGLAGFAGVSAVGGDEAGVRLAGWETSGFESRWCPSPRQLHELQATATYEFGRPAYAAATRR